MYKEGRREEEKKAEEINGREAGRGGRSRERSGQSSVNCGL